MVLERSGRFKAFRKVKVFVLCNDASGAATLTGADQNNKVNVTFGMNPGKKGHYGIMLYHKNRLIKAYEKVGCQLKVGETDFHRVGSAAIRISIVVSSPPDFRSKGRSRGRRDR